MSQELQQRNQDRRIAVGLFFFVLAVYLFTYLGAPKSPDERALFSGMDSLLKRGNFNVNQMYWDYSNVAMETTSGEMVPNYEPAQMILAIPFYLWGRSLGAALQGVMFFNAVVTAASVALLYLCFLELGYRRRTSLLASLIYAFATLAWPYSRVFFREPLTVLAYLIAFYALLRYRLPASRQLRWPFLAGLALGIALTTKQISVAAIPSLALLALVYEWRRPAEAGQNVWSTRLRVALAALLPLGLLLLLGKLYQDATLGDVELFARNIVDYTTNPQLSSSLPQRIWLGGTGLTISPFRGIFWYTPLLLLGLLAAPAFIRKHLWEGLAFLGLVAAHILGYSRYLYWSGGVAWGPRYMLPIIPFLLLLAAPVWVWLINDKGAAVGRSARSSVQTVLRAGVWAVILWSSFVAILGVLFDWRAYELPFLLAQEKIWGSMGQAIDNTYMTPAYSPVFGHIRLLLNGGAPLDFAWLQQRPEGATALVSQGLALSLVFVAMALAAFVWLWRRPARSAVVGVGMTLLSIVVASALLVFYRHGDARFDTYDGDRFLRPIMARLAEVPCGWTGCDETMVVPDPALTDYFLNYLDASLVWYGIEYEPVETRLLKQLTQRYGRIWLVRDRNAATDDEQGRRGTERYLAQHSYKLEEQQFDSWARLIQFSAAGVPAEQTQPQQALGEITLQDAQFNIQPPAPSDAPAQTAGDGRIVAQTGDTLQIGLHWRADAAPQGNYTVFVQLLDAAGQVAAQRDRWPGDGLFPTAALQAGQVITDNLALPLDVPAGDYRLITGLYQGDVTGQPRLTGPSGDFIELPRIEVRP
ncbi:MAG: phospholipid carrier-dependent glycosyltransferase [Anaerolineae bacterium]